MSGKQEASRIISTSDNRFCCGWLYFCNNLRLRVRLVTASNQDLVSPTMNYQSPINTSLPQLLVLCYAVNQGKDRQGSSLMVYVCITPFPKLPSTRSSLIWFVLVFPLPLILQLNWQPTNQGGKKSITNGCACISFQGEEHHRLIFPAKWIQWIITENGSKPDVLFKWPQLAKAVVEAELARSGSSISSTNACTSKGCTALTKFSESPS